MQNQGMFLLGGFWVQVAHEPPGKRPTTSRTLPPPPPPRHIRPPTQHNTPICRRLLKVAVYGALQCDRPSCVGVPLAAAGSRAWVHRASANNKAISDGGTHVLQEMSPSTPARYPEHRHWRNPRGPFVGSGTTQFRVVARATRCGSERCDLSKGRVRGLVRPRGVKAARSRSMRMTMVHMRDCMPHVARVVHFRTWEISVNSVLRNSNYAVNSRNEKSAGAPKVREANTVSKEWSPEVDITLLLKEPSPQESKLLLPVMVLEPPCKWFSRALLQATRKFDVGTTATRVTNNRRLGFRQGCQCMKLFKLVRAAIRNTRHGIVPCIYANSFLLVRTTRCSTKLSGTPCAGDGYQHPS